MVMTMAKKKVYNRVSKLKGMQLQGRTKDSALRLMLRREIVKDLRMKHKTLHEIAKIVKVSHTTVQKDLEATRIHAKEMDAEFWRTILGDGFTELDHLIKTNWQEWEISKQVKDKEGNVIEGKYRVGNPIFLQEIHGLVQTKLKLAGNLKEQITVNNTVNNNSFKLDLTQLYQQAPIIDPAEEAIKLLESNTVIPVIPVKEESVDSILERLNLNTVNQALESKNGDTEQTGM